MSREQRLEAALRDIEQWAADDPSPSMTWVYERAHAVLGEQEATPDAANWAGFVAAAKSLEQEATPRMLPSADGVVQPDEHGLVWDIRDGVGYDFAVGATILRLLNEGRWDDEGILLHMAARSLMEAYYRRLDEQEATPPEFEWVQAEDMGGVPYPGVFICRAASAPQGEAEPPCPHSCLFGDSFSLLRCVDCGAEVIGGHR